MNLAEIKESFKKIKAVAEKDSALVELSLVKSESFSTAFEKGNLKKYSSNDSNSATVRVIQGISEGFATTENLSTDALLEAYKEALQSAIDLAPSKNKEDAPALWSKNERVEVPGMLNLDYQKATPEEKMEHARQLEKTALDFDKRVQAVTYSAYGESKSLVAMMNSAGLDLAYEASGISAYSYVLSKQGEDLKDSGFARFSRKYKDIDSKKIATEAAERSLALLGAEQPKSGTYAVVFSNEVMSDLIDNLSSHVSAKALSENRTLLKGKIGEKIFSDLITIEDNPMLAELPGARPFDSEGAASQKTSVFENGVFKKFLTNSFYAKKLNLPHTANAVRNSGEMGVGPSNIIVKKGQHKLTDLLSSYPEVIYITDLTVGAGFQSTTLDFSLPASGFLYQNGKKAKPIHQFVISGNLLELLKNVEKLSDTVNENGNSTVCPDLLVNGISIAGAN